jgi:DinB superfamily
MNTNVSGSAPSRAALPDCTALRARLEETRLAYHTLVESLTDEEWNSKRTVTQWTMRELMSHIVDGLAHTPDAIEHVRRGKPFLTLPPFLNWLTAPTNLLMSKWSARGQTRQTILARYDAAHQALVTTIEGIQENEWERGAPCYGDGYKTVLDLCDIPNRHLQEHTVQFART